MTSQEKLNLARELMMLNTLLNSVQVELESRIEKLRKSDKRCTECGKELTDQEQNEGAVCNKCYGRLQSDAWAERKREEQ